MLFSSFIFLCIFLPFTLILYFLLPFRFRNICLLLVSLFFYAWGEPKFLPVMIVSIIWNYFWGLAIGRAREADGKTALAIGIVGNLLLLFCFKYLNFSVSVISHLSEFFGGSPLKLREILLPIGISFFTFQSISYLVDVYRDRSLCRKNFIDIALYISLFPQLIAGPIVRYGMICRELDSRESSIEQAADGLQRFIYGLGVKMLLANPAGAIADAVFGVPSGQLAPYQAWIGIIAYSLQIYFDFSGYSSMAIGLGRIFGFHFPENFNYPYIAGSISDFWRRWHISLSSWFRDYVYIPLGGSRVSEGRTALNLLIVFFLTGIWHGAAWTFLFWGMWYGLLLVVEKFIFRSRLPGWLMRIWTLAVIINGWVFFRSDSLGGALKYLCTMYGGNASSAGPMIMELTGYSWIVVLVSGCVCALPWTGKVRNDRFWGRILSVFILILAIMALAKDSYNPFLYFRF